MNLTEYIPLALRTEKPLPRMQRLEHGCLGLITEVGEITTELKRIAIYEKPLDEQRKAHILEEIGDVMWYVAILLDAMETPANIFEGALAVSLVMYKQEPVGQIALVLGAYSGKVCNTVMDIMIAKRIGDHHYSLTMDSLAIVVTELVVLAKKCDATLELAMEANISKLSQRYPDKYSNEAAEGRADKAGADARVS